MVVDASRYAFALRQDPGSLLAACIDPMKSFGRGPDHARRQRVAPARSVWLGPGCARATHPRELFAPHVLGRQQTGRAAAPANPNCLFQRFRRERNVPHGSRYSAKWGAYYFFGRVRTMAILLFRFLFSERIFQPTNVFAGRIGAEGKNVSATRHKESDERS